MIYAQVCSVVYYLTLASKQYVLELQLNDITSKGAFCIAIHIGFVLLFNVKSGLQRCSFRCRLFHQTCIAFASVESLLVHSPITQLQGMNTKGSQPR